MFAQDSNVIKKFNLILFALAAIYLLLAITFFFFSQYLFYALNLVPNHLHFFEAIPNNKVDFWLVFAASNMLILSAVSFFTTRSKNISSYIFIHLTAKVSTAVGFIYLFLNHAHYFAYIFIASIEIVISSFLIWSIIRLSLLKRKSISKKSA
mgnify:CR=1 FL=1